MFDAFQLRSGRRRACEPVGRSEIHIDEIDAISIRARQVLAAVCVLRFCEQKGIHHAAINAMVRHLCSLATVATPDEFVDWDTGFGALELDPMSGIIPPDVLSRIPAAIKEDFSCLIEFAAEVGMSDAYAAVSTEPREYLLKVFGILQRHRVPIPILAPFLKSPFTERHGWGKPVNQQVVDEWLALAPVP